MSEAYWVTAEIVDPATVSLELVDMGTGETLGDLPMDNRVGDTVLSVAELDAPVLLGLRACTIDPVCSVPSNTVMVPEPTGAVLVVVALLTVAAVVRVKGWRR